MNQQTDQQGPKYLVDIEGQDYPWTEPTITVPQLRQLAGWEPTQEVLAVDQKQGTERTLREDEVIDLRPGHGFAKKIRFKRGSST